MKHRNIPIFVTHQGCPQKCIFCDQKKITGTKDTTPESAREILEKVFSDKSEKDTEIAFFGGSFTAIERGRMIKYLEVAKEYIDAGYASGIRLSTRPDALSREILDILKKYKVETIEIGVQSLSDEVLCAARRGHTARESVEAMKRVKEYGFTLAGQMMTGLYKSTPEDEIMTAKGIIDCGADEARIYPTAVFPGTELFELFSSGKYNPPDISESIERVSRAARLFVDSGVKILRMGLCPQDGASDEKPVAGAYHESFGEMVYSRIYLDKICEKLECFSERDVKITVPCGDVSKASGHKGINKEILKEKYNLRKIRICESDTLKNYDVRIEKCI